MKCPKCGFVSFNHLNACKKCDRDLASFKAENRLHMPQPSLATISLPGGRQSSIGLLGDDADTGILLMADDVFQSQEVDKAVDQAAPSQDEAEVVAEGMSQESETLEMEKPEQDAALEMGAEVADLGEEHLEEQAAESVDMAPAPSPSTEPDELMEIDLLPEEEELMGAQLPAQPSLEDQDAGPLVDELSEVVSVSEEAEPAITSSGESEEVVEGVEFDPSPPSVPETPTAEAAEAASDSEALEEIDFDLGGMEELSSAASQSASTEIAEPQDDNPELEEVSFEPMSLPEETASEEIEATDLGSSEADQGVEALGDLDLEDEEVLEEPDLAISEDELELPGEDVEVISPEVELSQESGISAQGGAAEADAADEDEISLDFEPDETSGRQEASPQSSEQGAPGDAELDASATDPLLEEFDLTFDDDE